MAGTASSFTAIVERRRAEAAEHERRMQADPEYRAAKEREAAERLDAEWTAALAEDRKRAEGRLASRERARSEKLIPRRLWRILDAPAETAAIKAVRSFMRPEDARTFLVLAGGVGTGKTAAACWGLDIEYRYRVPRAASDLPYLDGDGFETRSGGGLFVSAMSMVRAGTFNEEFWEDAQHTTRLVIDDLGTEPQDEKGWSYANLCDLLNVRYDWQRKTVITTNLGMEAFKARYLTLDGGRLLDRLKEAGTFFECVGESMRRAAP